jgi:SAM-dependent methyltransferase
MTESSAFREFEHAAWGNAAVAQSYHRHVGELTQGVIPELMRACGVKAKDRVLDVACGAGYVAAAARERGADATGVDFSLTMIRLAEETNPGIRFVEGDAAALPFADAEFDVVLNAFGLPHFPDADKAAAEAFRVLRPGGCFTYASWCDQTKCVGFSMAYDAVRACGTLAIGLPPGPNFFGFGDPDYANGLLGRAGFKPGPVTEIPLLWRLSSPDGLFDALCAGSVRAGAVLRAQTPENLAKIKQYMHDKVSGYRRDGGYAVPTYATVVSARKAG